MHVFTNVQTFMIMHEHTCMLNSKPSLRRGTDDLEATERDKEEGKGKHARARGIRVHA